MTVSLNAMTGRVTKRAGRSARVGREISRNFQNGRKQLRKRQMFERYKYVYIYGGNITKSYVSR